MAKPKDFIRRKQSFFVAISFINQVYVFPTDFVKTNYKITSQDVAGIEIVPMEETCFLWPTILASQNSEMKRNEKIVED